MNDLPSLTALRMFVEAAHHSSFKHASSSLNVTQAAVSKQIAALEDKVGVKLFERGHRAVRVTPSGEAYLPFAEKVLAMLEEGNLKAEHFAEHEKLLVVIDHEFLSFVLAPRLARLRTALPNVDVTFVPETGRRVLANCDLAITFGHPSDGGFKSERLRAFHAFAVGAPDLLNGVENPLQTLPLLHDVDTYWWNAILGAEKIDRSSKGIVLGTGATAIRGAISGAGLAVGDDLLCADALASSRLIKVGSASLPGRVAFWISEPLARSKSKATQAFRQFLNEELSQISPSP